MARNDDFWGEEFEEMLPDIEKLGDAFDDSADSVEHFGEEMESSAKEAQALIDALEGISHNSDATNKAITALNSKQDELKQTIGGLNSYMSNLSNTMDKLVNSADKVANALGKTNTTTKKGKEETEKLVSSVEEMFGLYEKMGVSVDKLKVNMDTLAISEKEYNKLSQLAVEYNEERVDSYKSLSAQYRAMKILYDQMTEEERASNRAFVDQLYSMYESMNMIQQQSGKFQLQVGNYSKAMNGLNIATTQVVREMPTIANSFSQFAIAISNNIPIWVEAMGRLNNENKAMIATKKALAVEYEKQLTLGNLAMAQQAKERMEAIKTTTVLGALKSVVLSYQTGIVLLLTVLPAIIRNLERKRRETDALKESVKELLDYNKLWKDAITSISEAEAKSISTLQTLTQIIGDNLRSREEQIKAAEILRDIHEEQLGLYSAEEIVNGKARKSIEALTKKLLEQAKARGIINKITEYYGKYAEEQLKLNDLLEKRADAEAKVAKYTELATKAQDQGSALFLKNAQAELDAINEEYTAVDQGLQNISNAVLNLQRMIPVDGLVDELMNGKGKKKDKALTIADYYFDYIQSLINVLTEGSGQTLAQMDLDHQKEQAKLAENIKKLEEMRKDANATELAEINRQIAIVKKIQINAHANYLLERQKFLDEMVESYREEVKEEEFLTITEEQQVIKKRLSIEKAEREKGFREKYAQMAIDGEFTQEMQEELNKNLLDSEHQFWVDYLNELKKSGILTVDAYNEIMKNLEKAGTDRGRVGRRKGYANPIEALLAQTTEYGMTDKYGLRSIKQEYQAYANAINSALDSSIKSMREWIDTRKEMADVAIETAKAQVESAKQVLDYEMQARANGYAYNMEIARKEYEEKLALQRKAEEDSRRLARVQQQLDTAQQVSSLLTATANIWSAEGLKGLLGVPLAIAATGAMWASFISAKAQASKLTSVQYGEGMSEYLDYGGSHASGNDIDFGMTKDGRRRRVERGEVIGVINKRNVQKYGVGEVQSIINSLNSGTFEDKYGMAFAPASSPAMIGVDLSKLERDVWNIRKQGETRTSYANGKTIVQYKNVKRIING